MCARWRAPKQVNGRTKHVIDISTREAFELHQLPNKREALDTAAFEGQQTKAFAGCARRKEARWEPLERDGRPCGPFRGADRRLLRLLLAVELELRQRFERLGRLQNQLLLRPALAVCRRLASSLGAAALLFLLLLAADEHARGERGKHAAHGRTPADATTCRRKSQQQRLSQDPRRIK